MSNHTKRTLRKAFKESNVLPTMIRVIGQGVAEIAVMAIKSVVSIGIDDCITRKGLHAFDESADR